LWRRDPHTEAKHRILAGYYSAWFPILLHTPHFPGGVTVFEGFAGPGEYDRGEEGSPIIALRAYLGRPQLVASRKPVRFAFLEQRKDRADHLRGLVGRLFGELPPHVTCEVRDGQCEDEGTALLTDVGAWGHPIFANLDPFDAYVPLQLVRRLAQNDASEVLVTFMSDRLRRFARVESLPQGDAMFGSPAWRRIQHQPSPEAKEAFLVNAYRGTLEDSGLDKVAGFKLIDEGGRAFWLVYATKHRRGLERMKAAMWKVDPIRGFRFRDPRDPTQGELFDDPRTWQPDLRPLRRQLVDHLQSEGRVSVRALRDFALLETSYRPPHATQVISELVRSGQVGRRPETGRVDDKTEVWLIADEADLFGG
jgi:three-Cys-motif partner protein